MHLLKGDTVQYKYIQHCIYCINSTVVSTRRLVVREKQREVRQREAAMGLAWPS
jgi:hypothetical protein